MSRMLVEINLPMWEWLLKQETSRPVRPKRTEWMILPESSRRIGDASPRCRSGHRLEATPPLLTPFSRGRSLKE
jgi:hypothetical protein